MTERFFYHSFPRPRSATENLSRKGMKILRSIAQNGILLVPERVSWADPSATNPDDRIHAVQRRICFTELAPSELPDHARHFGPFALEFRIGDLRVLGALPVVYVPDHPGQGDTLELTGISILARLSDAIQVLSALADAHESTWTNLHLDLFRKEDGSQHSRTFDNVETAAIREYLSFVQGAPGQRFSEIVGALRSMASLFYPVENLRFTGELGYYRQREWRIVSGATLKGRPTSVVATGGQCATLLDIDEDFFSRQIEFADGIYSIAEKCHFMAEHAKKPVLERLHRVVAPGAVAAEAEALLREVGCEAPVIALESL